jgi:hypothetical protein
MAPGGLAAKSIAYYSKMTLTLQKGRDPNPGRLDLGETQLGDYT